MDKEELISLGYKVSKAIGYNGQEFDAVQKRFEAEGKIPHWIVIDLDLVLQNSDPVNYIEAEFAKAEKEYGKS